MICLVLICIWSLVQCFHHASSVSNGLWLTGLSFGFDMGDPQCVEAVSWHIFSRSRYGGRRFLFGFRARVPLWLGPLPFDCWADDVVGIGSAGIKSRHRRISLLRVPLQNFCSFRNKAIVKEKTFLKRFVIVTNKALSFCVVHQWELQSLFPDNRRYFWVCVLWDVPDIDF